MNIEQKIHQWILIDDQLKKANEIIQELREKIHALNESILNDVNRTNNRLKVVETKIAPPLTFKYVEKILSGMIGNQTHVKQIIDRLKEKREFRIISELKRISNN